MAIYKKGEFAKLCGIGNSAVSMAVSRGQIVVGPDNKIDTSNTINYDYMMVSRMKNGLDNSDMIPENKQSILSKLNVSRPESEVKISDSDGNYDIERKKKLADLEKKQVDIRIAKLQEQKLKGDAIPTSLVRDMIAQLSKSFIESYRDKSEQFIIQISHKNKLSANQSAEMKGELTRMINESHDAAIDEAQSQLKSIIQQIKP